MKFYAESNQHQGRLNFYDRIAQTVAKTSFLQFYKPAVKARRNVVRVAWYDKSDVCNA